MSLDAFRGFIMVALASDGFGFADLAATFSNNRFWRALGYQFHHVAWTGCAFWDLIQPSFMFMVGVAMAYSNAARQAAGQSYFKMFGHALLRSAVFVLLGIFLRSTRGAETNFTFVDVVAQIGLGYTFLFLLWNRPRWMQATAAATILVAYWLLFALYPLDANAKSAKSNQERPAPAASGWTDHWDRRKNVAAQFDKWFLNKLPRHRAFRFQSEGYATLNFVPSLATMIFGLMAGELLRTPRSSQQKFWMMLSSGALALIAGWSLDATGICPSIKILWTPAWTLFSAGWVLVMLASFYGVIDGLGYSAWSFPLRVVGMNSLAMYVMTSLMRTWWSSQLRIHFGRNVFASAGAEYAPFVEHLAVLLVMWALCWWMYRQRIFVRI